MFEPLKWSYYAYVAIATITIFLALQGYLKTEVQEVKLTSISDDVYIFTLADPAGYNTHATHPCTVTPKANWKFLHENKGATYKANVRFRPFLKDWNYCTLTEESEEHFKHALSSFNPSRH